MQQRSLEAKERPIREQLGWPANRPLPLFLHAHELLLYHPSINGGKPLLVTAPQPQAFSEIMGQNREG